MDHASAGEGAFLNVLFRDLGDVRCANDTQRILDGLDLILQACRQGESDPIRLILAGEDAELDQSVARLAQQLGVEPFFIGLCKPDEYELAGCWLTEGPPAQVDPHLRHNLDETRLFYADLLVVAGTETLFCAQGEVEMRRVLIEAIQQRKPVVWIDPSDGRLHWLDPKRVDPHNLALMDARGNDPTLLKGLFCNLEEESALCAFHQNEVVSRQMPQPVEEFNKQLSHWGKEAPRHRYGWFHSAFLRLFGYPKIEWQSYQSYLIAGFESPEDSQRAFWAQYHELDRAAVHSSLLHRDQVVAVHLLAAFAVLFALLGTLGEAAAWGVIQLIALGLIPFLVYEAGRVGVSVHQTYLSLRHGAEMFRVLAMLRPFLACLPSIERAQRQFSREKQDAAADRMILIIPQIWWVLRCAREKGIPLTDERSYVAVKHTTELKAQLKTFIKDQQRYHQTNSSRWHRIHRRVEGMTIGTFLLTLITVALHLLALLGQHAEHQGWMFIRLLLEPIRLIENHSNWMFLVTAFGPALTASLYGISGKLEIARIASKSRVLAEELATLLEAVERAPSQNSLDAFLTLHDLAMSTAKTLYAEHEYWVNLLHGQELELPV